MDEELALLAAIKAGHPDEDTTRLAYADWLDEHDRCGHAAATRLAVELVRTMPAGGDAPPQEWLSRYGELLEDVADNAANWFGDDLLEWMAGPNEINTRYRREAGFDRGMLVLKGAPFQINDAYAQRLKPYVTRLVVTGQQGGPRQLREAVRGLEVKELCFFSSRHSVTPVMQEFMIDPEASTTRLVYLDFGGSVSNYQLANLCGWSENDAASLKEVRVGPGRIGTELSRWDDPHGRADLIELSLGQFASWGRIRARTRSVIKKVKYCAHPYWRF